ncbi:hypothetical protein T492DRAFT_380748 [Pavlovales sp. CCMP2436]|nr:hypothetical protein T492DRAFT_380748 [Pavlovales sp. CCMP2436]
MVQPIGVVQSLAWSTSDQNPHAPALTPKGVSVCAPAPTPHLGRASAAAALPLSDSKSLDGASNTQQPPVWRV